MMLLALAAAVGFAGGVWLIVSAMWPPRPSLAAGVGPAAHAGRARGRCSCRRRRRRARWSCAPGGWLLRRVRGHACWPTNARLSDLAVVARPLEVYAGTCALCALVRARRWARWRGRSLRSGGCAAAASWCRSGLAMLGAALGFLAPRLVLRAEAAKARSDFRHALSAYLDVLVLLLAAGEGPEGAMETAARAGNGPAFIELRRATVQARLSGEPIWDTLDDLGRRLGRRRAAVRSPPPATWPANAAPRCVAA